MLISSSINRNILIAYVAYKKKQMRLTFNPACQSERQTPSESVY